MKFAKDHPIVWFFVFTVQLFLTVSRARLTTNQLVLTVYPLPIMPINDYIPIISDYIPVVVGPIFDYKPAIIGYVPSLHDPPSHRRCFVAFDRTNHFGFTPSLKTSWSFHCKTAWLFPLSTTPCETQKKVPLTTASGLDISKQEGMAETTILLSRFGNKNTNTGHSTCKICLHQAPTWLYQNSYHW